MMLRISSKFSPVAACLIAAMAAGCATSGGSAARGHAGEVDLVLQNGHIATMDGQDRVVSTVVVDNGRIVAVGDASVADAYTARETLDLGGQTVLPGFVDNHVHPRPRRSLPPTVVDLRYIYSWEENERLLREAVARLEPGEWLRGSAFRLHFASDFPATPWHNTEIDQVPDRHALDAIAPDNPVLIRVSQFVVANSKALELAGITRDSQAPEDGRIERDADGEPTGILWYAVSDAIEDFAPALPPIPAMSAEEEFQGYKTFFEQMRTVGATSVNVASARSPALLRLYQELHERYPGELPRMTVQPTLGAGQSDEVVAENIARLEGYGWRTGAGNEWVKLGAIKMALDGGYTFSRPWALNEEPHRYVDTYYGGWRDYPDYFYQVMKRAHDLGWQLGLHAAGDRGARIITDVLARILTESPREDHRHHLIHFEVGPTDETYEKMKQFDIGVAMQPNFIYGLQPFFGLALEGERLQTNNPGRSVLDRGLHLSYGNDERPYGPLLGIYAAVTRRGYDGNVYGAAEAVTVKEAVRAYTIDSAWHNFDEHNRGSIEPGKFADFVVLSEDIFEIDPVRIKDVRVMHTIIGGRVFDIDADAKNTFYPDDPEL